MDPSLAGVAGPGATPSRTGENPPRRPGRRGRAHGLPEHCRELIGPERDGRSPVPGLSACSDGRRLDAVTAGAPEGRSWLLTAARAGAAAGFYRRLGWHQATHPGADRRGVIAFLGPRHPGGLPS